MNIVLATHNSHKAEELSAMLKEFPGITISTLADLQQAIPEPEEDGATLEENAYIKAAFLFAATGQPVIADDTGLEVHALGGAPGIYSARYAGNSATYDDNCRKLLTELDATAKTERTAQFRTVLCYIDGLRTLFAEGEVQGSITTAPAGANGFGYDPVFRPEGYTETFAEMSAKEKNSISHRGRALEALRDTLAQHMDKGNANDE